MRHLTEEEISELIDGLIILSERQKEHLHHCPECSGKLSEYQKISVSLKNLPIFPISNDVSLKIRQRIETLEKGEPTFLTPRLQMPRKPILGTALIVFLFIVGTIIGYQYNRIKTNETSSIPQQLTQIANNIHLNEGQSDTEKSNEIPNNIEEDILLSLGEEYVQNEYLGEELHSVTISDLILSLAEEAEEFDVSM